jgi:biopolymer transport protein ExbD
VFNLKDFIEEQSEGETDWEIDLSPLLALMVTLIPVLLLQTSFATLSMLETSLPILSDAKQEEQKKDKDEIKFDLDIFAKDDSHFELKVQINDKEVKKVKVVPKDGKFDLEALYAELSKVKKDYPKEIGAKLTPGDKVNYDMIVKMLDVIRKDPSGTMYRYKDKEGQLVETAMLFPDVVFGNIAE